MCTTIATTLLTAGLSIAQGVSADRAARAEAATMEQNARNQEIMAQDAVKRGGQEETKLRRRMAILRGQQRAQAAASGLEVDSGSMADIQDASMVEGEHDVSTNAMNHARESWGHNVQAVNYKNAASAARAAGKNAFMGGLLGAGGSLLSLATPAVSMGGSNSIKLSAGANQALDVAAYTPGRYDLLPRRR